MPEELPAPDLLQDSLPIGAAGNQPPAIAQGKHECSAIKTLGESHPAQVDQQRTLDPHETQRPEHSSQVLHRVARKVTLFINMQRHVIRFRLYIVDRLNIYEVQTLRLLSRD